MLQLKGTELLELICKKNHANLATRLQAVFLETVLILSKKVRSKKITVKGGFYSREDMKNELGYSAQPASNGLPFTCMSIMVEIS